MGECPTSSITPFHSQAVGEVVGRQIWFSTRGKASAKATISSFVVSRPMETRISALASEESTPMAASTWEGETEPEEHAEPLLTQKPSRSKAERAAIESVPFNEKAIVFGREKHEFPRKEANSDRSTTIFNCSKRGESLCAGKTGAETKCSKAEVRPIIAGTFSVPARRSFSCVPP